MGWGVAYPLKTIYSHMFHHTKFRRHRSSRLSVGRGPKKFCGCLAHPLGWGRGQPPKTRLITMQNLVVVSHTVRGPVEGPKNLTMLRPTPWEWDRGMVDALRTCYSPMWYHTKFLCHRSNHLGVSKRSHKFLGRLGPLLGTGVWMIPKSTLLPTC